MGTAMCDLDKLRRLVLACIDAIRDGVNNDLELLGREVVW
jgi:hypothetical protein